MYTMETRKVLWLAIWLLLGIGRASAEMPQTKGDPVRIGIETNLLHDALAVPNIGIGFYWNDRYSLTAGWEHAWWKSDKRHRYWRLYGGDLTFRRWIGKRDTRRAFTGHHLGVYGQLFTFDFEWGKKGWLGDEWNYGGGLEYGFALPIARRLHIDFSLGLGYQGGKYKEYLPIEGHYVWQATKRRHYWGVTQAKISLVGWLGLIPRLRKGGRR